MQLQKFEYTNPNISKYPDGTQVTKSNNYDNTSIIENYISERFMLFTEDNVHFPNEILESFFSFCQPSDVVNFRLASKRFKQIIDESKSGVIFKNYAFNAKGAYSQYYQYAYSLTEKIKKISSFTSFFSFNLSEEERKLHYVTCFLADIKFTYKKEKKTDDQDINMMDLFSGKNKFAKLPFHSNIQSLEDISYNDLPPISRINIDSEIAFILKTRTFYHNGKWANGYRLIICAKSKNSWVLETDHDRDDQALMQIFHNFFQLRQPTFLYENNYISNREYEYLKDLIQLGHTSFCEPGKPNRFPYKFTLVLAGSKLDQLNPIKEDIEIDYSNDISESWNWLLKTK